MLNEIAKNIIIKALRIRKGNGENPEAVLETYRNLTETEKTEILELLETERF